MSEQEQTTFQPSSSYSSSSSDYGKGAASMGSESQDVYAKDIGPYESSPNSYWHDRNNSQRPQFPSFPAQLEAEADIVVIGGGILGLTTAAVLRQEFHGQKKIILLEGRTVASGVSGNSTAKVTALHRLHYSPLLKRFGQDRTRQFAQMNVQGLLKMKELVHQLGIQCDWEEYPAYVYTTATSEEKEGTVTSHDTGIQEQQQQQQQQQQQTESTSTASSVKSFLTKPFSKGKDKEHPMIHKVREEGEATRQADLPTEFLSGEIGLPFPVKAAVRLDNQAQMDPVAYCLGLAKFVDGQSGESSSSSSSSASSSSSSTTTTTTTFASGRDSKVYENSRVVDVKEMGHGKHLIHLENGGKIRAEFIVVATHMPILDRGGYWGFCTPSLSYCVALSLKDQAAIPRGMYISAEGEHTRSIRPLPNNEGILVGGEGHKQGDHSYDDTRQCYKTLIDYAEAHFPVDRVLSKFSAHDFVPADSLPYIGPLHRSSHTIFVGTGFEKWGFAVTGGAAMIIRDLIQGRDNAFYETVRSTRLDLIQSASGLAEGTMHVTGHLVGDRLKDFMRKERVDDLQPNEGGVVKDNNGKMVAAYRDPTGKLHKVSPTCTHMGCHVVWNTAERSWDCPCHGSRFTVDGEVISGPACKKLPEW